jgi:hypothetical protein
LNPMYSGPKYLVRHPVRPTAGAAREQPSSSSAPRGRTHKVSSGGLPHSEIPGSQGALASPGLIAECHVLHRLLLPRHPPNALLALDPIQKTTGSRRRSRSKAERAHGAHTPRASRSVFQTWKDCPECPTAARREDRVLPLRDGRARAPTRARTSRRLVFSLSQRCQVPRSRDRTAGRTGSPCARQSDRRLLPPDGGSRRS